MDLFIQALGWGTALMNIAFVALVLGLTLKSSRGIVRQSVREYARLLIFLLSAASLGATLLMEYVFGLPPCLFCWWQRIFMYPTAVIAAIAIVKNSDTSEFADYVLGLSVLGAGVALYQHLLQMLPSGSLIPCDAANECSVRSVFELGYITLPWMALSAFALLALISFVARKK